MPNAPLTIQQCANWKIVHLNKHDKMMISLSLCIYICVYIYMYIYIYSVYLLVTLLKLVVSQKENYQKVTGL